jgi:hypothetical protein
MIMIRWTRSIAAGDDELLLLRLALAKRRKASAA